MLAFLAHLALAPHPVVRPGAAGAARRRHPAGRAGAWCCWCASPRATAFPAGRSVVGPLAGALLWPIVSWLLLLPQRRARARADDLEPHRCSAPPSCATPSASCTQFQLRIGVAGVAVLVAFGLLAARFFYLQVVQHEHYARQGRGQPHLDRAGPAQPRPDPRPQRRGDRAQLLGLHARDLPAQGDERRAHDRRARRADRHHAARPRALQEAARGDAQRREPADPHAPVATRKWPSSPPTATASRASRSRRACSASTRTATSARTSSATWAASTQDDQAALEDEGVDANYRGTDYIGKAASRRATSASCTAPPASSRSRSTPPGAASARCSRTPAQPGNNVVLTLDMRLQQVAENAFGDRRGALVAIEPGDRRACSRWSSKPGFDPNLFVDGIDPQYWAELNTIARPAAQQPRDRRRRIRPARPSSRSWRSPRSRSASARRAATINDPGYFDLRRPALPRLQAGRPRRGRPVQVDRGVLATRTTTMLANDMGIDAIAALHEAARLRRAAPAST